MAQVPYSPVPDVVPTAPAAPKIGVSTPPQAFGVTTAEAVQRLGGQAEQSANELAQTALYVKQLQNDTWAKNNFVEQSAKIADKEDYLYGLKGQEAVNAAPGVRRDIQQIYRDAVANAPNPQAGRMLGDQLSRRVAYSTIDIGKHAGTERLRAAGDASASTMAVGLDLVSKNPYNDDQFNDYVKDGGTIDQEAANLERLGFGKAEANAIKIKNQYWEGRFESLYGKPDQAQALFDQHESEIPPAARANIIRQIKSSESTAKFIASYSAALSKTQGEADVSAISSRNRIIDPATGQAGYGPNAIKELTDYARQHPEADKEVEERLKWVRQANEDAAKGIVVQTNPDTFSALTQRMFDPDHPTNERDLAVAENSRLVSTKDREWLANTIKLRDGADKAALADPRFKLASDAAKALVEGTTAKDRMINAGNYAAFQYQFLQEYLKKMQENKLNPEDLNMGNENSMVRKLVETYVPGIGQTIRSNGGVSAVPQEASPAVPSTPPPPVPSREALKVGESYTTRNNGIMIWTGTGFLTPEDWARKQKPAPNKGPPEASM